MNRSRKNLKIRKIAAGIPRGTIFLTPNDEEVASENIVHEISLEATNSAFNKIMIGNLGDKDLYSGIFRVKNFAGGINQLAIHIGITNIDEHVENSVNTEEASEVIPPGIPGFHQKEVKFMRIIVHVLDIYNPLKERHPDKKFIYKYIKEILEHELVHASEKIEMRGDKINELSKIEDPNNPLSSFYHTTREEIAAHLKQITVELEHDLTNNDFKSLSIDEILERSHTLPGILESLRHTEDIKTPFGNLNRRKDVARKKFLSALYSWIMDKKESLKDNDGHKVSRLNKLKSFFKVASENTLDQFLGRDDLPIFEKTSPKELVRSVQKNLISAGYDLPRYGADGDFGRETEAAILRFKQDHGISGDGKSLEQSDVLKLNSAANLYNQGRQRARSLREILNQTNGLSEPEGDTLLFGDSQMQGGIGDVLVSKYPGKRLSKVGSQAQFWANNPELETELEKLPSNIIIQLNSNGISGTKALLKKIKDITPNSNIRWYGAPPATISRSSWSPKVRTLDSLRSFNEAREANNTKVIAMLSSSGLNFEFINPFEIRGFTSWTCSGCDGIHVPKSVAQKYYARV